MKSNLIVRIILIVNIIICSWFMFSCTPQQRFSKLLKKNPSLVKSDSILIKDSVLINGKHATFNFDTTIYNYNSISNGIEIHYKKQGGKETIEANTKDTLINRHYYNYTNNYITKEHITLKQKIEYGLIVLGVISLLILIIFVLIKIIK